MEKNKEVPQEKPKELDEVELTEVVTETGLAFRLPTGEIVNESQYLVWLGNLMWKINKSVG